MQDMFLLMQIIIAITTAATSLIGVAEPPAPSIELHDDVDPRWTVTITEDLDRFTDAQLGTFAVDVHVWNSTEVDRRCHGHVGYFTNPDAGPRIDLCLGYFDSKLGNHLRHKLVLHELGHAWAHSQLTDTTRQAFMDLRGAKSWNGSETNHAARGTEKAADTIMSALHPDEPASADVLCGYETLTGRLIPIGRIDPCSAGVAL